MYMNGEREEEWNPKVKWERKFKGDQRNALSP